MPDAASYVSKHSLLRIISIMLTCKPLITNIYRVFCLLFRQKRGISLWITLALDRTTEPDDLDLERATVCAGELGRIAPGIRVFALGPPRHHAPDFASARKGALIG